MNLHTLRPMVNVSWPVMLTGTKSLGPRVSVATKMWQVFAHIRRPQTKTRRNQEIEKWKTLRPFYPKVRLSGEAMYQDSSFLYPDADRPNVYDPNAYFTFKSAVDLDVDVCVTKDIM